LLEIRYIVARELGLENDVKPSDRLVDDLGLDSLTMTTLAIALEDHFQVILSDEHDIQTVGDLARRVAARTGRSS
jgi:acyl carrier protein